MLLILGGLLAVGISASASAAPVWLAERSLPATVDEPDRPQIAVDPQGDALALWYGGNLPNGGVQTVERNAGGNWSGADTLSGAGEAVVEPKVGVDDVGDAVVVWARYVSPYSIRASVRTAGGSWSDPTDISKPAEGAQAGDATQPQVAVNARGDAVAAWKLTDGTSSTIQAAVRPAATGAWSDPAVVPNAGNVEFPQVAIDDTGNAIVVWRSGTCGPDPNSDTNIQAAIRQASGEWGRTTYLSRTNEFCNDAPQLAVNGDGIAVVVWPHDVGDGKGYRVQTTTGSTADTGDVSAWTVPRHISAQDARDPQVSIDGGSNAVAVWKRYTGTPGNWVVESAAHSAASGNWSSPAEISPTGYVDAPQVAANGDGRAVAVWAELAAQNWIVRAALGSTAGAWSEPSDVSVATEGENVDALYPQVAVDDSGNAVAIWERYGNDDDRSIGISAAGFDAAGPQLNGLSMASQGTVGEPLSFSVSPLDVWSDITSTAWDFGDGMSAAGTSVTHTYSQPGTYDVQVSSTDAVGNASARSQAVVVSAAPSAGAPALVTAAGPNPVTSTGAVAVSRVKMRIRCAEGKRIVSCRGGSSARRRLEVSFRASAAAKVKIQVTQSLRRMHGGRHPRTRTLMYRTVQAVTGANRFTFPLQIRRSGRLVGTISVEGGKSAKSMPVRGVRPARSRRQ